jgi:putative intracellular protease/amidase
MGQKVLFVVTSHKQLGSTGKTTGFDLLQVSHPLYEFENAGFDVTFVSPLGGPAPMDENTRDISDPLNRDYLGRASFIHHMENTLAAAEVSATDQRAIIFAGGLGALWDFPENAPLARLAVEIFENKGVVAGICHGTAALLNLHLSQGGDLLKGRKVTGFSQLEAEAIGLSEVLPLSIEMELQRRGAQYSSLFPWQRHCVVDGNLVTGQNPASARGVGEAVVKLLRQKN